MISLRALPSGSAKTLPGKGAKLARSAGNCQSRLSGVNGRRRRGTGRVPRRFSGSHVSFLAPGRGRNLTKLNRAQTSGVVTASRRDGSAIAAPNLGEPGFPVPLSVVNLAAATGR